MNALARLAVLALFMLALGCGRVGAPLPPLVRKPAPIQDLAVAQNGNTVTLSWTTPSRYEGGDPATDLAATEIFRDGVRIETIQARVAGQRQSYDIPTKDPVDTRMTFNVRAVTTRGKVSAVSNMASVSLVEPPGPVQMLTATVDQRRIHLEWEPPEYDGSLVFIVARNDGIPERVISGASLDDRNFEVGRKYTYWVTAARSAGEGVASVRGIDRVPVEVTAKDETPPSSPTRVQVSPSADGALVVWSSNTEEDFAGYRLKRGPGPEGPFIPLHQGLLTSTSTFDPGYSPGLYYAVFAVDESGNENLTSVAVPGP